MNRRVLIFGAGEGGRRAYRQLRESGDEVVGFVDNDRSKHGTRVAGLPVYSPPQVASVDVDVIVVASVHCGEIYDQLIALGVSPERIEVFDQEYLHSTAPFPRGIRNLLLLSAALAAAVLWCWFR